MGTFEDLVSSAWCGPFHGWDFSCISGRYEEGQTRWDYRRLVLERLRKAKAILDLGTGGGEFLSSLGPMPAAACATEGYHPNAGLALANLRPRGVGVVETRTDDNGTIPQRGALPFRDLAFDLVFDRHEVCVPSEVRRVLKAEGVFVTQQVGDGNNVELRRLFGSPAGGHWNLARAAEELEAAGLRVLEKGESSAKSRFVDVGALVYYLKAVTLEVPGFSVARFENELRRAHETTTDRGHFEVTTERFYVVASR